MYKRQRLIGRAVLLDSGKIHLEVAPYAVKNENPLSGVDDVFNAILIHGNYSDDIMPVSYTHLDVYKRQE